MKSRPLLMKHHNVWATLQGHKTETRRLTNRSKLKARDRVWIREQWAKFSDNHYDIESLVDLQFGLKPNGAESRTYYRADTIDTHGDLLAGLKLKWRNPLFMPKWASRLILNLAEVRQERLGDITEAGAIAEGVGAFRTPEMIELDTWPHFQKNGEISQKGWDTARLSFISLWNSIGKNDWLYDQFKTVWVYRWETFEVIK